MGMGMGVGLKANFWILGFRLDEVPYCTYFMKYFEVLHNLTPMWWLGTRIAPV
jgi:hypothetical protein